MKNIISALLLTAMLTLSAPAGAAERLDDQAIRTLVVGKTLLGQYPSGVRWRETFFVDEETDYQDPEYRLRGTWYAQDDALCTFYEDATDFEGSCFITIKRSDNCVDFYAIGSDGEPVSASQSDMALGVNWTARGWRSDQNSTCPQGLTS
ncbi:MAG: hypothetical protein WA921_04455 [Ahrensia sp.]